MSAIVQQLMSYNVVVGSTDLDQLENWMAAKAGITL